MGNATSSAMRADDAMVHGDDGPAFGSLASLGGPRKFKKKPVLVLDPEELEKAHLMFQEASAELLGEEVERHEKPRSILGLAPMDDEDATPEDMGASDDGEAGDDDEAIPSAEDVLRMTGSRPATEQAFEADDVGSAELEDAYIAQQLESLDVDHRIFPSLPLKSEEEIAAEEEAERLAAQAAAEREELEGQAAAYEAPAPRIDSIDEDEPASPYVGPFESLRAGAEDELPQDETAAAAAFHTFPVNPLPEPEAELEPLPEPEAEEELEPLPEPQFTERTARSPFGDEPFLDFPTQPLRYVPEQEAAGEYEPDAVIEHAPEPEEQFEPEAEAPEEVYHYDEPEMPLEEPVRVADRYEEPAEPEAPYNLHSHDEIDWEGDAPLGLGPDYEPEPEAEPEPDGNYTEIEDEPVDGYAFMYAHNPRARTLHALAEGESNSLRAKLLKERADAMAEMELAERQPSIWARFTAWLRSLSGPKAG